MIKPLIYRFSRFIAAFSIISLLASSLFLPAQLIKIHAAETISLVFDSENDPILNTSNVAPGLRVLPNTAITYYVDLINDSSTISVFLPAISIEYPVSGFNISSIDCRVVNASSGVRPSDSVFDTGTACPGAFITGTTYSYSADPLPASQTAYFRITNIIVTASTGTINSSVTGDGEFLQTPVDAGPVLSYVTTTNGTLSGNVFYDNGTSVFPTNANNGAYDVGFDHLTNGVVVIATDGISNFGAVTDSLGDYSITVPANDILSFPASSAYDISAVATSDYYYTTGLAPTGLRVADAEDLGVGDLGINNQVDLSLAGGTITPAAISYTTTTSAVIHYGVKNNSLTDASNITVSIPLPSGTTANGTATLSTGSYVTGAWTIPTIVGGATETLDLPIIWGAPGTVNITAEITDMISPALIGTTPGSISNDPDSLAGTTIFMGEDDIYSANITVNAEPTISGRIFQDTNNSGTNNSEPGLVRTVHLYNNDVDPGAVIGTTTSDSSGIYTFDSSTNLLNAVIVSGAQYHVEVAPFSGFTLTTGTPAPVLATSGAVTIDDIGYFSGATISGFAFEDTNNNGVRNLPPDGPIGGVTVQLLDSSDAVLATTTTAPITSTPSDGKYTFTDLIPGTYRIRILSPSGTSVVPQNIGSDEVNDSDISPSTNHTGDIIISFAQLLTNVDGGFFNSSTISGNVFQDLDYNGLDNSDPGFPSISVTLNNVDTGDLVSTSTDSSGDYHFDNLIPGNYQVEFTAPTNFVFVPYHISGSDLTNDSDVRPESGHTETIVVSNGNNVSTVNAGLANNVADLHLTKTVNPDQANVGENVVYTLLVINNGPNTSTGAVVNDTLPSGLTFVSSNGDGTYSNSDGDWHLPDLLNGSGATMNITATVTAAGVITNTALITGHLQPDDNTADNTDDATVTGIATNPSLAVLKSVQIGADITETTNNSSGPQVAGNQSLTYYIDVANTSGTTIANLSVDDVFPTGIASTGWTCSYDVATGALSTHTGSYSTNCTMQASGHVILPTSLSANAVLHIRLTGHTTPVSAGTYCNQVSAVAQGISTAVTDSACFQVPALAPPVLQITHGSNQTTVIPGSQVTYTITVTNNGGSAATNVVISDNLGDDVNNLVPSCVTTMNNVVINNNGVISTNDPTTVLWSIGTLQPGESRTVSIITTIRSDISSTTNCQTTAIASGNNVPSTQAEANISVPVQLGTALVTVNKEVIASSTVYEPGDTIQYRVTMNNAGNGASSALTLDDALPTNIVRWQSIQSSLGTLITGANLAVENIILPANSRNVVTYTGVLKDSDTFSLKPWKLDSGADKNDNDFYAEQVVKARIFGTSDTDGQSAVGALDQQSVSLGQGGSIILATSKTGKVLVDGDGDDFCLAIPQSGTRYRVSVAQTNQSSSFEKLKTSSKNCFDISSSDLPWIRYIKVEDQSASGVTSTSLDAVCLLHVGGLLRNTANVLQANNTVATDAEDIVVDFTDVFDDPISASACTAPKQARVLAPVPLPPAPAPVVIPTPVPVVLPKTGSDTLGLTVILSGLVAMFVFARRKYSLGSKK